MKTFEEPKIKLFSFVSEDILTLSGLEGESDMEVGTGSGTGMPDY